MRRSQVSAAFALALTVLVVGACSSDDVPAASPSPEAVHAQADVHPVPLRWPLGRLSPRLTELATGSLGVTGQCWTLTVPSTPLPYAVAFPPGVRLDDGALDDGAGLQLGVGDEIEAVADEVGIPELTATERDEWAAYVAECTPDRHSLLLLDQITAAVDPGDLTEAEMTDLITDADLSIPSPCGFGFFHPSPDGHVGLVVERLEGLPEPGAAAFPDPEWRAQVLVGRGLGVGACDDAHPMWFAPTEVVASFDLGSGRLTDIAVNDDSDECRELSATLSGAVVELETGPVALPTLQLHNPAYLCF